MADDLKLSVVIEALLNSKGFEDAQASLKGLADKAKEAAAAQAAGAGAQGAFADSQRVSSREVKILTAELLRSVGATEGVGSAGRLAATALAAMGSAAEIANFAMAGLGFGVAFLLPRIIEWMSNTEETTKKQKDLEAALRKDLAALEPFLTTLKGTNAELEKWAARDEAKALGEQDRAIKVLQDRYYDLNDEIRKYAAWAIDPTLAGWAYRLFKDPAKAAEQAKQDFADVVDQLQRYNAARAAGVTLDQYERAGVKQGEAAIHDKTAAIKIQQDAVDNFTRVVMEDGARELRAYQADAKARIATDKAVSDWTRANQEENARIQEEMTKRADADWLQYVKDRQEYDKEVFQSQVLLADASVGLLGELFGKNKTAAIAQAIIDTYAGADKAFAQGGTLGFVTGAAIIVQGMANVAQIEKQKTGFDDPFADLTARKLGRRSAVDFVNNFAGEFIPGVQSGMRAAVTNNHSTTINRGTTLNLGPIHGVIGSRTEFRKWLAREMTLAQRQEDRTTVGV